MKLDCRQRLRIPERNCHSLGPGMGSKGEGGQAKQRVRFTSASLTAPFSRRAETAPRLVQSPRPPDAPPRGEVFRGKGRAGRSGGLSVLPPSHAPRMEAPQTAPALSPNFWDWLTVERKWFTIGFGGVNHAALAITGGSGMNALRLIPP